MNLIAISDLSAELRPNFKLAPVPTIERAIRQSAISFCSQSLAVQEMIEDIDVTEENSDITVAPTAGLVILEIVEAWYNKVPLILTSERELAIDRPKWRTTYGIPTRIFLSGLNQISLATAPNKTIADAVKIKVAVSPTRLAVSLPEELGESYWETIRLGAESLLMGMQDEPWASPNAGRKELRFMAGISAARARVSRGSIRKVKVTKYGGI